MQAKRAFYVIVLLSAFLPVSGCGGSGGGHDNPPTVIDPDDSTTPDDTENSTPLVDDLAEVFAPVAASANGKLKDNLVGVWLVTTETVSREAEATTRSVGREIVYILPGSVVETGATEPPFPNSIGAQLHDCTNWMRALVVPKDPAATTATVYVGDIGPKPPLTIINDTRMEEKTANSKTVWQKIDVPLDADGKPQLGTVDYQFSGTEALSGTATIDCLAQGASSQTGGGRDVRDVPLLVSRLTMKFDTPQQTGYFELTINIGNAVDQLGATVFDKTTEYSAGDVFTIAQDAVIADKITIASDAPLLENLQLDGTAGDNAISISWQRNH